MIKHDPTDPRNAKASTIRYWFIVGLIGEATYRASLRILGLSPKDIDNEVSTARMEKTHGV